MNIKDELRAIAFQVADLQLRQEQMTIEIVTLGDRLNKAVDKILQHPELTDEMKEQLQELLAGMQLAILELQGKEPH